MAGTASMKHAAKKVLALEVARLRLRTRFQTQFVRRVATQAVASIGSTTPTNQKNLDDLNTARQKIRTRFSEKFLVAQKSNDTYTPARGPVESNSQNSQYLQVARDQLRRRLAERFPDAHHAIEHASRSLMQQTRASNDALSLEEARLRIRESFQRKFQPEFADFPSSIDEAMESLYSSDWGVSHAAVVTSSTPPYTLLMVNEAWEDLCGFKQRQVYGQTFESLGIQGSFTERSMQDALAHKLERGEKATFHLTNATNDGRIFKNYLRVAPLVDNVSHQVTHFIAVLEDEDKKSVNATS